MIGRANITVSRNRHRHIPNALRSWIAFGYCAAATVMAMNGLAQEQAMPQDNSGKNTGWSIDEACPFP